MADPFQPTFVAAVLERGHVGQYLASAAEKIGCLAGLANTQDAFEGPRWLRSASWRLRDHRPPALHQFNKELTEMVAASGAQVLVTTGIAPILASTLRIFDELHIKTSVYLTDDPWNPAHRARWFLEALPHYDHVLSTRRSNLQDLTTLGCKSVDHLPFGYEPTMHFPEEPTDDDELRELQSDIVFVGGADSDRIPSVKALIDARFDVALYGGYWDRHAATRLSSRGLADPRTVRKAIGSARVSLCLVRRANRDGTSMRTFEVPAMRGCPLVEYTEEHFELFGEDGANVVYFRNDREMVDKARLLTESPEERRRLTENAHLLIVRGNHTYEDRLRTILRTVTGIGNGT